MKNLIKETIENEFDTFLVNNLSHFGKIPYKILINKNKHSDTAYYYYKPPHNILIGSKILDNIKKKVDIDIKKHYINSFLYHELSHSFWSHPIKKVNILLKKMNIPFSIYNIFEDARIEEKFRQNFNRKFLWKDCENLEIKTITPLNILFYFIFIENFSFKNKIDKELERKIIKNKNYSKVEEYYNRVIKIKDNNIIKLFKLLKEFWNEFKNEEIDEEERNNKNNKNKSLEEINSESVSPFSTEFLEGNIKEKDLKNILENSEIIINSMDLKGKKIIEKENEEVNYNVKANNISYKDLNEYSLFFEKDSKVIQDKLKNIKKNSESILTNKLKKIFKKKYNIELKEKFSKSMNITKLILDEDKIYKHKYITKNGLRDKEKIISLIVDTSGSMYHIVEEINTIIYIFNKLNQYGYIKLNIILSGGNSANKLQNYLLPLPVKDEVIASIKYIGAHEGFKKTFIDNEKILKKSNYIFILTDGLITDNPIDKNQLNKIGIYTQAIYIAKNIREKEQNFIEKSLIKYFDQFILKQNVKDIFETIILKYIKL